jgi:glycosyltransferase involved in cell wall biosynthesis
MKICILTPEYSGYGGGIGTYYSQLGPALVQAGHDVFVFEGSSYTTAENSSVTNIKDVTVVTLGTKAIDEWITKFWHLSATPRLQLTLAAAWALWDLAQKYGPFDIVEATDFALLMVPPIVSSTATVAQMHGSIGQIQTRDPIDGFELEGLLALTIESSILGWAASVQSPGLENALEWQRQSGVDCQHVLPAWTPPQIVVEQRICEDITVVGRIQLWKGPSILAAALRLIELKGQVNWYGRDVQNSALGSGSTLQHLMSIFPDIWGKVINARSQIKPEEVFRVQSTSKLNLVCSTWDVFNFTVVEAMASGRPVLCSDKCGASSLIVDGVNGFVYDGTDPAALASKLSTILALDESKLASIGVQGKRTVTEALRPPSIAGHRVELYKPLIGNPKPTSDMPDWLTQLVAPRPDRMATDAFLEQHSARRLVKHLVDRLKKKIGVRL